MNRIPRTEDDLRSLLGEQLGFLKNSSASYDHGYFDEAKRLAHGLRVLLHDTPSSHSLLGQLHLKSGSFLDTAFPKEGGNLITYAGLVSIGIGGKDGNRFLAQGDDSPSHTWKTFDDWWEQTVFVDDRMQTLTRRSLTLTVCNQDGGSHIDPALDEVYARLTSDNSLGWVAISEGDNQPLPDPARPSVRQIAHELLRSLDQDFRWTPRHNVSVAFGGATVSFAPSPQFAPQVGRNSPCPCGSGRKFKKCHGQPA